MAQWDLDPWWSWEVEVVVEVGVVQWDPQWVLVVGVVKSECRSGWEVEEVQVAL